MEIGLITPYELRMKAACGKVFIVDVREPGRYNAFHICGAVNIPECEFDISNGRRHHLICRFRRYEAAGYDRVLYCDRGNASMFCAGVLVRNGIHCFSLLGGLIRYKNTLT